MAKKNKSKNNKNNNQSFENEDDFKFMLNPGESHIDEDVNLTNVVAIGFWCKVISKGCLLINIDDISIFNKNLDVGDWDYFECEINENIDSANLKFESCSGGVIQVDKVKRLFSKPNDFKNKTTKKTNEDNINEFVPLKTDFEKKSTLNISNVEPATLNRINSFINLINEKNTSESKFDRKDYILNLVENDLQGLVLDNTFIELDKPLYFNKHELKENGVVKTTKVLYENDLEETIVIERTPNNLDVFNYEYRSYCCGDKSIHAGVYIIPNLDGGDDYYLNLLYDSDSETITIRMFHDIDTYFNNKDKDQLEIKENLLSRVAEIKTSYQDGKLTNLNGLEDYCIMYDYLNHKKLEEKIPFTISSDFKDDVKKELFEHGLKGLLFKDF